MYVGCPSSHNPSLIAFLNMPWIRVAGFPPKYQIPIKLLKTKSDIAYSDTALLYCRWNNVKIDMRRRRDECRDDHSVDEEAVKESKNSIAFAGTVTIASTYSNKTCLAGEFIGRHLAHVELLLPGVSVGHSTLSRTLQRISEDGGLFQRLNYRIGKQIQFLLLTPSG